MKSFRHKGLKRLFETGERRGVSPELANRLRRQLDVLNRARTTRDMNLLWLGLQQDVDLWDTHRARRKEYDRIKRVPVSKTR